MNELPINFVSDLDDNVEELRVHIRIRQRGGRKHITTIEDLQLSPKIKKKLIKDLSRTLSCAVYEKDDTIECSGDQRQEIVNFLISHGLCTKKNILVHGY